MARGSIELCSFRDYFPEFNFILYFQKLKGGKIAECGTKLFYIDHLSVIVPGVSWLVFTDMKLVTSSTDWLYHRSNRAEENTLALHLWCWISS